MLKGDYYLKLEESLASLEDVIVKTKDSLTNEDSPAYVGVQLNQYLKIIQDSRLLVDKFKASTDENEQLELIYEVVRNTEEIRKGSIEMLHNVQNIKALKESDKWH